MSKILLTSGCSFSECISPHIDTWPRHLTKRLEQFGYDKHISTSMGSQGNGLISRGILYNVIKALETYDPSDILVGVMWSGSNRHDYRCYDPDVLSWGNENVDGWIENPTSFIEEASKNWIITNLPWEIEEAKLYYKYFYDPTGATIYSLEHILRLQWFLKSKNVPYFFTNYVDNNIVPVEQEQNHIEYDYLLSQIDHANYLPVTSEHAWLLENSVTKEDYQQRHWYDNKWTTWVHPSSSEHAEFVDGVIMPYLEHKEII